jgi:hypothetical protein
MGNQRSVQIKISCDADHSTLTNVRRDRKKECVEYDGWLSYGREV